MSLAASHRSMLHHDSLTSFSSHYDGNDLSDLNQSQSPMNLDPFHSLILQIRKILGPTSGISSSEIDPSTLINVMTAYQSNETEWSPYAFHDTSRNYTRNLVDNGNQKSNLIIVVWSPGKHTPIHDHADAHCIMKILKGSLRETLYDPIDTPSNSTSAAASSATEENPTVTTTTTTTPPKFKATTTYTENQVTYISDQIGLHKIQNASDTEIAVSLHLYTPPHAADFGFNIFDERSGKTTKVKQADWFSEGGRKVLK